MLKRILLSAVIVSIPANSAVHSGGKELPDVVHFVKMPEIMVPIVNADAVEGLLRVDLVLTSANDADAARLDARIPTLREATLAAALEFSRLYASGLIPVDAELLAGSMQLALQRDNPEIERVLVVKVAASVS